MKKNLLVALLSVPALALLSGCGPCCKKESVTQTTTEETTTTVAAPEATTEDAEVTKEATPVEEAK